MIKPRSVRHAASTVPQSSRVSRLWAANLPTTSAPNHADHHNETKATPKNRNGELVSLLIRLDRLLAPLHTQCADAIAATTRERRRACAKPNRGVPASVAMDGESYAAFFRSISIRVFAVGPEDARILTG